jgi:hypothetical protein
VLKADYYYESSSGILAHSTIVTLPGGTARNNIFNRMKENKFWG